MHGIIILEVKYMKKIVKIWFDNDHIYGEDEEGVTHRQSLLWYNALRNASDEERSKYSFGFSGIHWRELDEDISFESFEYEDAEPSPLQRFFLSHKEINIAEFSKRLGVNATLLRNYINGFKKPSQEKEKQILLGIKQYVESLSAELPQYSISYKPYSSNEDDMGYVAEGEDLEYGR